MDNKYVATLEYSIRLKELGVKQDSDFYWVNVEDDRWTLHRRYEKEKHWAKGNFVSAFHVGELGDMLPLGYSSGKSYKVPDFDSIFLYEEEQDGYICYKNIDTKTLQCSDTEANARAKMLIYLIENGLMEVKP